MLQSLEDSPLLSAEELAEGDKPPVVFVAISDGASFEGRPTREAAEAAATLGISIHTVAIANPETTGARFEPDIPALQEIAFITEGEFHQAVSSDDLDEIFESVAARVATESDFQDVGHWFSTVGGLLVILGLVLFVRENRRIGL